MTKRVLFVSIAFPPKGDPECIQTGRYFHYLSSDSALTVDVVTSRSPTLFMPVDAALTKYANVTGQLIELPIFESKYSNFFLRKLMPVLVTQPDSKMTFHWQWKKAVRELVARPDVIYSRSYPLSSAIMALKLARHFDVPWIMHLSDPWTENALHHYSKPELERHDRMEKACFKTASMISVTSEKTASLYKRKYPEWASKITVFPNVFDPADRQAPLPSASLADKKRIVYTGGLANTRNARTLLQALDEIARTTPTLLSRLEVLFAGDRDRQNYELFSRYSMPSVKHLGLVSAADAKKLQESADLLVVIDSKIHDAEKAVFFPSKLLDYSILDKPILAITDKGSATDEFVVKQGGVTFAHESSGALAAWLRTFAEGGSIMAMKKIDDVYSAREQASRLANIFKTFAK